MGGSMPWTCDRVVPVRKLSAKEDVMETALQKKSRETVEQLLARRKQPKTYQEQCQYALDLVAMHLEEENPERIDECIKLYTEDAVWETPARAVTYTGRERIKDMYLRIFNSVEDIKFQPVERFATPERVFDDMWVTPRKSATRFGGETNRWFSEAGAKGRC